MVRFWLPRNHCYPETNRGKGSINISEKSWWRTNRPEKLVNIFMVGYWLPRNHCYPETKRVKGSVNISKKKSLWRTKRPEKRDNILMVESCENSQELDLRNKKTIVWCSFSLEDIIDPAPTATFSRSFQARIKECYEEYGQEIF
ncbi:hypothetical protein WA026_007390 [Henosepilachna vigintioctopunctata]|uniref:Uncharacterized protein n=1 Tax=Henosepilachna vigintioctopunctata TaxID=420089 RepID=A0AAW1ULQ3_9CUCU